MRHIVIVLDRNTKSLRLLTSLYHISRHSIRSYARSGPEHRQVVDSAPQVPANRQAHTLHRAAKRSGCAASSCMSHTPQHFNKQSLSAEKEKFAALIQKYACG